MKAVVYDDDGRMPELRGAPPSTVSTMSGLWRSISGTSVRCQRLAAASMNGRRSSGSVTTRAVAGTSATTDCFR